MDLSELNPAVHADAGAALKIRHPLTNAVLKGEDGEPVTVDLYGLQSATLRKKLPSNLMNRALGVTAGLTQEDIDDAISEVAFLAMRGASSNFAMSGAPFVFSEATARDLCFSQRWVSRQIWEFILVQKNFFPSA